MKRLLLLLLLLLVGCSKPIEEVYVEVEITGHYVEQVLVNGELQDRYYITCALEEVEYIVNVQPSTGLFAKSFEEQFVIGTKIQVLESDVKPK